MGNLKTIDLFSGMGALSLGFEKAGFSPVLALDSEPAAAATYALNRPRVPVLLGDCRRSDPAELLRIVGGADAVIGGVPCEPFSSARIPQDSMRGTDANSDPRRGLIYYALKIVVASKARVFAFENVRGVIKSGTWARAKRKLASLGYDVDFWLLRGHEHGAATIRARAFLVGVAGGKLPSQDEVPKRAGLTVREAFAGLGTPTKSGLHANPDPLPPGIARNVRLTKPGACLVEADRPQYRRPGSAFLAWGKPSLTLIAGSGSSFVHPSGKRLITAREAARIQGVPDSYRFAVDSRTRLISLLGDCVPIPLAFMVASAVKRAVGVRKSGLDWDGLLGAFDDLEKAIGPYETARAALPTRGLIISPAEFARAAVEGRKTSLVKPRLADLAGDWLLVSGREAYGAVRLGKPEEISLSEFRARVGEHLVTEALRREWAETWKTWGTARSFWSWPIEVLERFEEPRETDAPVGPQATIREVRVLEKTDAASGETRGDGVGVGEPAQRDGGVAECLCQWCGARVEHARGRPCLETPCPECGRRMGPVDESAKAQTDGYDGRECAPTHPSGEQQGRRIHLHEVLNLIRPFRFRQDALTIVGGIVNRGWTDNDIDVLIKGPLDEDTLHVLKFRFGRMLGPELSQRVQYLSDSEFGGPFTDHVPLGNLMFETATEFKVKEMRDFPAAKQNDPLQDLPLKPGKLDAVVQNHARGRTLHWDLRIKISDYLVGATVAVQRAGVIKEPITTVAQLNAITRNYDVETGNKYLKPVLAPKGLFATPKPSRQPVVWMDVEDRVFPAGTVGGTKEHVGVFTVMDRPKIEYGRQSPRFHEYFVTGSKLKDGIWFLRMLVGEEEEVPEEEVGRITPAGEVFWKFSISKTFMPSILKPRTVERKVMPPDGWSWIPRSLEKDVPPEFRYWRKKGAEARRIRDALVEERIFTERTVGLVDGEFRLVREKRFVVNDGAPVGVVEKQPKRAPYALSRQSFRGPVVVRGGFSKVFWWLVLDDPDGKGVRAWRVQTDPLSGEERMSAVEVSADETRDKALLELSGDQPPGSRWNPTKATLSDVRRVGEGSAELLEEKAGFLRLRFLSGPLRGVWTLAAEEPGSLLWELSAGSVPGVPMNKARGEGMGVGGPLTQDGGADSCVCPSCGITVPHTRGIPCVEVACPKCGLAMVGGTAKAGVPTRDGVQIWDPDKKRPDADRTDLRPLANFAPMKPREGFFDPNELIGEWATPEIVAAGLDTEPKLNGLHTIAEVDGRGRTFIYFEDSRDDRSEILPGVAAGVKALGEKVGPFILDAELLDFDEDGNAQPRRTLSRFTGPVQPQDDSRVKLMAFRLVYGLGRNWTADPRSDARPALEKFFEKAGRLKHLELIPFKTVGSVDEIPGLVKWATEQPGGEGALFKMHESTYTLGRFTSSWAKLKVARAVRAIVVEKIPKTPPPGQKIPARTFVYRCAVGPISKKALDNFGSLVQIHGEWYTEIGKTFATNVQAGVGQTLEVQATEFLVDLSGEKKTVHWFTPVVAARTDERPSTFDEVVDATFEHEIKRAVEKFLDGPVRVLKAESSDEERIVCGVVLEPRTDSQEDFASKDEIRRAAYEYMEFYRGTGLMHRERIFGGRVRICESWVQRGDTEIGGQPVFDGSWLMTWRLVDDGLWADAKSKKLGGFSIQGSAVREPIK